ncbi:MAG: monofunctional biosynthetic peptidoglycan transglycosylase [Bacteroidia bacterium]
MKEFFLKILRFAKRVIIWFFVISILSVIIFRWVPIPFTPLMLIRCVEQKSDGKEMKMNKHWVSLDKISERLPEAVIASEDQNFEDHYGFDLEAIEKAQKYNERMKGRKVHGASTISQQTAKNVFLTQSRSYLRKGFEVYFTFLIEIFWSKERIMEVYLNVIEMGDGVYGAEAASQSYFNKPASKLTASEASLIAACLPNPFKFNPSKPSAYIQRKSVWIMKAMKRLDYKDF